VTGKAWPVSGARRVATIAGATDSTSVVAPIRRIRYIATGASNQMNRAAQLSSAPVVAPTVGQDLHQGDFQRNLDYFVIQNKWLFPSGVLVIHATSFCLCKASNCFWALSKLSYEQENFMVSLIDSVFNRAFGASGLLLKANISSLPPSND
jgi:hypothetical protein